MTIIDVKEIERAFELMKTAKRPVIVAGGGLLYSGAYDELKEIAELWGAAVITTMAGKSSFPEDHPLYGWHGGSKGTDVGNYLCRTADVILSLGCRFADETTSSYRKGITYNFPEAKLIQVDIDPNEIGKNYPCSVGIVGDVRIVLRGLIEQFKKSNYAVDYQNTEYFNDIQQAKNKWFDKLDALRKKSENQLTISQFIKELNNILPKESIIVTSSGHAQAQIFQEYCFKIPRTHITTGGFSTMGFAFPASIGIKLARPDVPVIAIAGDGDFLMTMQELSTAVQYDINVIVILINNNGWMAIRDLQIDMYGEEHDYGSDFIKSDGSIYSPNYKEIAENFGFYSQKITEIADVKKVVQNALESEKPSFIEVIVSREYPQSGGVATGWWDVPVPEYISNKAATYKEEVKQEYLK